MKNKYINTVVSLFIGILLGITGTLAITNQQQNNEIIVAQKEITEVPRLDNNDIEEINYKSLTDEVNVFSTKDIIENTVFTATEFPISDLNIVQIPKVVKEEKTTEVVEAEPEVEIVEQEMYVSAQNVNIRENPTLDDESIVGTLGFASEIKVLTDAENNLPIEVDDTTEEQIDDSVNWVQCMYEGNTCYVSSDYIVEEKPELPDESTTYNTSWEGEVLNSRAGVVMGPIGKESYYNLPMSGVVSIMRNAGFSEEEYPYWVRSDGAKMLGSYIMVAADLSKYPRGSIVETTLGKGLVCDTGGFVYSTDRALDIAVAW